MLDILKALKQSRNPTVLYGTRRFTAVFTHPEPDESNPHHHVQFLLLPSHYEYYISIYA